MRFVSSRELRNNPAEFREVVEEEDVVLTLNGKPFAIALAVDEKEMEDTLRILRQVRALQALSRLQAAAGEKGVDRSSWDDIEGEIRKVRRGRRRGR